MKNLISAITISILLSACVSSEQTTTSEIASFDRLYEQKFHQWFAAEFDNHEQHWQDNLNLKENPDLQVHEHIHHVFAPLDTPALDGVTYFVKQYMDGDPNKVYRQRLYQFVRNEKAAALQLNIYRFNDEAKYADAHLKPQLYENLTLDEIQTFPGCEVYWRFVESDEGQGHFDGSMGKNTCSIVSKRSGKRIFFNDTLKLTDNEIWIADMAEDEDGNYVFGNKQGIPHINRKVTYFTGWGGVRIGGKDAMADAKWHFSRNLLLHNEGQIIPLVDDKTAEKSGYSIQLALLTYQNTSDPIFKFGLIDDATGKTITYIWSDRENPTTGMNLRWMQAGLKKKQQRPHFSF